MRGLMRAGMRGDIPVMIACHVSGPDERRLATRLDLLDLATRSFATDAPTLILVGEAVYQGALALMISEAHARQMHGRSEEHTSELQSLMRISYAVFCLKIKQNTKIFIILI